MSNINLTIAKASAIAGNQAELARRLGVPPSHVSGWKNGRPCPKGMRVLLADQAQEDVAQAAMEAMLDEAESKGDEALATTLRRRLKDWGRKLYLSTLKRVTSARSNRAASRGKLPA